MQNRKDSLEKEGPPLVQHIVRFESPVNSRLWNSASQLVIKRSWLSAGKSDDTSPITRHILDKRGWQLKCLLDEPSLIKRRSKPTVLKPARTPFWYFLDFLPLLFVSYIYRGRWVGNPINPKVIWYAESHVN